MKSITNSLSPYLISSTANKIGDTGATSLSEALKSNTTLTVLNLKSEYKIEKTRKRHPSTIHSFPFLVTSTGNHIKDTGVTSLSEALKSNSTLVTLNLDCLNRTKQKRNKMTPLIELHQ